MKRCFALAPLALCAALLASMSVTSVQADDLTIDLRYDTGLSTWQLYAEVTGSGAADGSLGISAVRALINGINFGSAGDGVTMAGGIGAINPINGNPPVLDLGGGLTEVLYGQDISDTASVVTGVGNSGPALLASGTLTGGAPSFGLDGSLSSQGLFLVPNGADFAASIDPNNNVLLLTDIGGGTQAGDFDNSGAVGNGDLTLLLDSWGAAPAAGWVNDVPAGTVGNTSLTILLDNWGQPVALAAASVPEPSSMVIAFLASIGGLALRRRS